MKEQKLSLAEFAKLHEADVLTVHELTEVQGGNKWGVIGDFFNAISAGIGAYFGSQNEGISAAQSVCNNALLARRPASASYGNFTCQVK